MASLGLFFGDVDLSTPRSKKLRLFISICGHCPSTGPRVLPEQGDTGPLRPAGGGVRQRTNKRGAATTQLANALG